MGKKSQNFTDKEYKKLLQLSKRKGKMFENVNDLINYLKTLKRYKGFTLVELLIVVSIIGLLAAGATVTILGVVNRGRFDTTIEKMENLKNAIIGNPSLIKNNVRTDFGYVGDMGRLPTGNSLAGLVGPESPAWNPVTQCGWHGPYIRSSFQEDSSAYQRDGWGDDFVFDSTTGVITSKGSDGVTGGGTGWPEDINSEALNTLITNSITVKVYDGKGNPAIGAVITVYYPNNGTETNAPPYTLIPVDSGMYTFNSIPTGLRRIVVVYQGETYTKWVAVVPKTTVVAEFKVIASPTTPNAPTGLSAIPYSTTQIKLNWTAPTLNTDGSTLVDLISYNIYRSITTGAETFLINTINKNTSFLDTGLSETQTYYYKIAAVNSGSKISAQTAEASAIASPVQQRAVCIPALGNLSQSWRIPIQNYGQNTITISSMNISWTRGAVARDLQYVQIGPNGSWTKVWGDSSVSTPTGLLNFSPSYSLTTVDVNREIRLYFVGGAITLESLTIRINQNDGYLIVY